MKNWLAAAAILVLSFAGAAAAAQLTEHQTRTMAIAILQGDPYGTTPTQVAANIKQAQLIEHGYSHACREPKKAVWEFHVVTRTPEQRIDGYLALDARTGKLVCTNLPLLD